MPETIRQVEYFYTIVDDRPGEGHWVLGALKDRGINLLAFTAFPVGAGRTQLDLVPERSGELQKAAAAAGISLTGPRKAFVVQGDDRVGALAETYRKLREAGVNVHAANGISDGRGGYGFIVWVKPTDYDSAARALGI